MYKDKKNKYGCSLEDQDGRMAVRDFDAVIARLSPELRAAFEAERAARRAELAAIRAAEASAQRQPVGDTAPGSTQHWRMARRPTWRRAVGAAMLLSRLLLRMIAPHRAAARRRAGTHGVAERVLSDVDRATPATAIYRYGASWKRYYQSIIGEPGNYLVCEGLA